MMSDYFFILLSIILVSLLLDKYWRLKVFENGRLIRGGIIILISVIIWESYAEWKGHWIINPEYLVGIYVGYVPLESFVYGFALVFFSVVLWNYFNKRYQPALR